ncbi:MAG: hypothetical protein R3B82_09210 [Sandaracinaceae bacterium]
MSARSRALLAALALCLGAGCEGRTAAVVEVDAADAVRRATRSVTVWVRAGEGRVPRLHQRIEEDQLGWPLYVVLVPDDDGIDDDEVRVSVRAYDAPAGQGRLLSSRYLRGVYAPGVDGLYRALLDEDCAEVECNEPLDQSCYYGACVPGDRGLPTETWSSGP